jgi:hypothetical protein
MIIIGLVIGVAVFVIEELSRRKQEAALEHEQEQKRAWKLADGHESLNVNL